MPRSLRRVALSLPLAVLLLVAFGVMPEAMPRVSAQLPLPKYKVGDRVEVDTAQASTPERAVWKKGTVTKVDGSGYTYQVQLDPAAGQSPRILTVPLRPHAEGWLRPLHSVGA